MFLLKEGIQDIQNSIKYIQGKTDINLGDWVKTKSFKFLTYIVTSLLPGSEVINQAIEKINLDKIICDEFLDIAVEYIIKKALSEIKNIIF